MYWTTRSAESRADLPQGGWGGLLGQQSLGRNNLPKMIKQSIRTNLELKVGYFGH